jgi:S-adenosylmethionine hydrolase
VLGSAVARHITNDSLFRNPVSQTFHGRDIFAPVAARLAAGTSLESVGPTVSDLVTLSSFRNPTVLRVDKFGNLQTNLRRDQLGIGFAIRAGGIEVRRILSSYSEALPGEIFAIEGSAGLVELCLNQGSAANRLNLQRGAEFEVETGTLNQ